MEKLFNTIFVLFFFFIIVGCNENKIEFLQEPTIVKNPNSSVPLAAIIKLKVNKPVSITIDLVSKVHSFSRNFDQTLESENAIPIVGMKPGKTYKININLKSDKTELNYFDHLEYTTPELPTDPFEFPRFSIKRNEQLSIEPGITLFNPRRNTFGSTVMASEIFGMLVAVDSIGEVVWYYRCDSRISDFNYLPNGHISYMTADHRFVEIDLLGNIVNSWFASERPDGPIQDAIAVKTLTFHHDAYPLTNGNYLILGSEIKELENYYTSENNKNAPREKQKVMGDVIIEFNPAGEIVWEWHVFDYLDPYRIGYETFSKYWYSRGYPGVVDWSHANTILFDPTDNTVVLNSRYLSSLIKINRSDKSIKWLFGETTGLSEELLTKSVKLINGDWFWHQHSPSLTPDGTILIFNNDNYKAWPFDNPSQSELSYAVEYRINEDDLTAEQLWTSKIPNEKGIRSFAMGDTDYLENTGNILVSYGALRGGEEFGHKRNWSMIREFTHNTPTEVIWELQLWPLTEESEDSVAWVIFSAERLKDF